MSIFRANPLLVAIVVLLFGVGYGEQIFGQFVRHCHESQTQTEAGARDHERRDDRANHGSQKTESCCLDHLTVIGTVPLVVWSLIVNRQQVGLVETRAACRVEAPVRGIEHPPQLA